MSKNIQKVKDMVDGNYKSNIQSGYSSDIHANREVGERYFDHDEKEWEKTSWGRKSVDKLPAVGLGNTCPDCEKLIVKKWDKDSYRWNKRCYYCQIDYEAKFPRNMQDGNEDKKGQYDQYLDEKFENFKEDYIKKWEEDNAEFVKELEKMENPFDKSVANALANGNVEMTINKNKNMK